MQPAGCRCNLQDRCRIAVGPWPLQTVRPSRARMQDANCQIAKMPAAAQQRCSLACGLAGRHTPQRSSGSARGAWAPGVFLSLARRCRPGHQTRSCGDANRQPPGIESGKPNDLEFGTPGTTDRRRANEMVGRGPWWA
jgi:hypothetical protein